MGQYVAPSDMLRFGAGELAQIAAADDAAVLVPPALLRLTIEDGDRSAYTAEQIADADLALARVIQTIVRAESEIDNACRNRYTLPLSVVDESVLGVGCDLARYYLYDSGVPEEVERRAKAAREYLARIARGEMTLSAAQASSGAGSGMPQISTRTRVWDDGTLGDF